MVRVTHPSRALINEKGNPRLPTPPKNETRVCKVKCPISEHALIPNNSDNKVNYEAQIELNLFVRLSNYTVALALQYDDNDFIVAHFSVTQSAWILRHSK